MNACIEAECRAGVWHLVQKPYQALSADDEALVHQAQQRGRVKALDMYRSLGASAGVWQLELPKASLDEGEIAMGLAAQFAARCCDMPHAAHNLRAPVQHLSRRSVAMALQERGQRVAGAWLFKFIDPVQFGIAAMMAGMFWLVTLLRSARESSQLPERADFLVAVHGEWSNRTRHVLELCKAAPSESIVIVLGRPKATLKELAQDWSRQLGVGLRLARPFNLLAAMRSLPHAVGLCVKGAKFIVDQPYKPRFTEQVAMNYRCFLGAASARWWHQHGIAARTVVYGHTGLADTTLLELAQQQKGSQTVHAVHGISAGLNFTGRSSVALFRCEHDARWHEQLGGYAACQAYVVDTPSRVSGVSGLLFLSNHLHPMNPWFRAFGPTEELRALSVIAGAADELGIARSEVVWKPHPVFSTLNASQREAVLEKVQGMGFRLWPKGALLEESVRFQYVVCTRSTVALDVLRLGLLPIILDTRLEETHDVMSTFPYQADSAVSLSRASRLCSASVNSGEAFSSLWSRIGPAMAVSMSQCCSAHVSNVRD